MKPDDLPPQLAGCWRAHLDLLIEARAQRSVLARNRHEGPLRVQKALYPEGEGVCQVLVLHPPAGIAGGDQLRIEVEVTAGAHAQLTTPGAGKWYKARGAEQALATQAVDLRVAPGAVLEWLPQEVIVFDRANALATTTVTLAPGARAIGWDILCLGRQASGEQFAQGCYRQRFRLQDEAGRPLWQETMQLGGGDAAMSSAVALEGHTVFGSLWIAGTAPDAELVGKLRELRIRSGACGVSALPHVTVLRLLSNSSEHARQYFEAA